MKEDMISSGLTNESVWKLIKLQKWFNAPEPVSFAEGTCRNYNLQSSDRQNSFILDVRRGRIELKYTMQLRANSTISLVRLDVNGTHTNPSVDYHVDAQDSFYSIHEKCIGRVFYNESHIHIYREGFGDRWAYPVDGLFDKKDNIVSTFEDFLKFCCISRKYVIQEAFDDPFTRN